jgi:hypothetical protein
MNRRQPYSNDVYGAKRLFLENRSYAQRRFIGGLITRAKEALGRGVDIGRAISDRVKKAVGSLFSNNLPKTFRDTLEKYKDNNIVNVKVCREPLSRAVNAFANIVTAGTFNEVAQKQGEAGFFHLYSILTLDNGVNLLYEKNERPVLQATNKQPSETAECRDVNANVPLGDFISNAMKKMGESSYISYDPIQNNCQDFLLASLLSNGLSNSELDSFIKQDTQELIEKTPAFSKQLGKSATGLGGTLRQIWEELFLKKGGVVKRSSFKRRK